MEPGREVFVYYLRVPYEAIGECVMRRLMAAVMAVALAAGSLVLGSGSVGAEPEGDALRLVAFDISSGIARGDFASALASEAGVDLVELPDAVRITDGCGIIGIEGDVARGAIAVTGHEIGNRSNVFDIQLLFVENPGNGFILGSFAFVAESSGFLRALAGPSTALGTFDVGSIRGFFQGQRGPNTCFDSFEVSSLAEASVSVRAR